MTWVRLDDGMPDHPKVAGLKDRAFRVHVTGLCYCGRFLTDGYVPKGAVKAFGATKAALEELVTARLWLEVEDGWVIKDFTVYNPTREKIESDRERRKAHAKRAADARWGNAHEHAPSMPNGMSNDATTTMHPNPSPNPKELLEANPILPLGEDAIEIKDPTIPEGMRRELEHALRGLRDATQGTAGRFVGYAKRGATPAIIHDAVDEANRAGVVRTSRSALACSIIERRLSGAA